MTVPFLFNTRTPVLARVAAWCCATAVVLAAGGGFVVKAGPAEAPDAPKQGPTLLLGDRHGEPSTNSVAAFMYFVPLISPAPVTAVTSPGSTQAARVVRIHREQSGNSFTTTCDFEFSGQGSQQSVFDCSREIKRHEPSLRAGGTLERQLRSITVTGPGHGQVEVEGILSNTLPTVTKVRMRFNAGGQASPVSIALSDFRYVAGDFRPVKEVVARVNTLTFRRKAGPPKMEVTVASVKNKGAGDNLWQGFKGSIKGMAVNLLIDPLRIETSGQQAMLDFGQALADGATSFTFPRAKNLKPGNT
jgi:hypothetical protein